jgi:hypothetical protein
MSWTKLLHALLMSLHNLGCEGVYMHHVAAINTKKTQCIVYEAMSLPWQRVDTLCNLFSSVHRRSLPQPYLHIVTHVMSRPCQAVSTQASTDRDLFQVKPSFAQRITTSMLYERVLAYMYRNPSVSGSPGSGLFNSLK